MPQGSIHAIDGEGYDAATASRYAAKRRGPVDAVEKASIRRRAHPIAVEILHFRARRADRLQRAVGHVDPEHVDATAHGGAREPRCRPADIGKELTLRRQRKLAK